MLDGVVLDALDVLDDAVLDVLAGSWCSMVLVVTRCSMCSTTWCSMCSGHVLVVIGSVVVGGVVIGGEIMICLCDDVVGGPLVCGIWQFGHGAIGCTGAVLANHGLSVIADMATLAAIAAAPTTRFTHIPVGPLPGFGPDDLW